MKRFDGSIVVVTGATSGIGLAVTELFLKEGATVVMAARNRERGGRVLADIRARVSPACRFMPCDVSVPAEVEALFSMVEKQYGRLDVLHNNAGITVTADLEHTTEDDWDRVLDVNLKGAFLCTRRALPLLKKSAAPAIVNTISELGFVATPGCLAYLCSKGGLLQLTRGSAVEFAKYGIRVNAVCPSGTESEMFFNDMSRHEGGYEASVKALAATYPLGRIAVPMDIAPAVLFLASKEAAFITGASLLVDGGFTAT